MAVWKSKQLSCECCENELLPKNKTKKNEKERRKSNAVYMRGD